MFLVKMHIRFAHTLTPKVSKAKLTKRDQSLWWVYQGVDRRLTVPQFAWRKKRGLAKWNVVRYCIIYLQYVQVVNLNILALHVPHIWMCELVSYLKPASKVLLITAAVCLYIHFVLSINFSFHRYTCWSIFCFLLTTIKPQI